MRPHRNERSRRRRQPAGGDSRPCTRAARSPQSSGALEPRLVGRPLPDVKLQYAYDAFATLAIFARRWPLVIFFYPGTEQTTTSKGAQSVSADERRAVAWMRCEPELSRMGHEVIGVSAQSAIEQARFASRDPLPYMLLSDPTLKLAAILGLPTTGPPNGRAYEPLSIVVREQHIARVFYPVDPANEAAKVMRWIRDNSCE